MSTAYDMGRMPLASTPEHANLSTGEYDFMFGGAEAPGLLGWLGATGVAGAAGLGLKRLAMVGCCCETSLIGAALSSCWCSSFESFLSTGCHASEGGEGSE